MADTVWYVVAGSGEKGPFTATQLKSFAAQGKLKPSTRIRKEGMDESVPAKVVKGLFPIPGASTTSVAPSTPAQEPVVIAVAPVSPLESDRPANAVTEPLPVQHRVGRPGQATAPTQKMAALEDDEKTANPYAAPRADASARGERITGEYAGFGIRVLAYLIDAVIMFALIMILAVIVGLSGSRVGAASPGGAASPDGADGVTALTVVLVIVMMLLPFFYFVIGEGMGAATLGKKALGLVIVDANGKRIGFAGALLRNLVRFGMNVLPLGGLIDVIFVAFQDKSQAVHDLAAKTFVIRVGRGSRSSATRRTVRTAARGTTSSAARSATTGRPGTGGTQRNRR